MMTLRLSKKCQDCASTGPKTQLGHPIRNFRTHRLSLSQSFRILAKEHSSSTNADIADKIATLLEAKKCPDHAATGRQVQLAHPNRQLCTRGPSPSRASGPLTWELSTHPKFDIADKIATLLEAEKCPDPAVTCRQVQHEHPTRQLCTRAPSLSPAPGPLTSELPTCPALHIAHHISTHLDAPQ